MVASLHLSTYEPRRNLRFDVPATCVETTSFSCGFTPRITELRNATPTGCDIRSKRPLAAAESPFAGKNRLPNKGRGFYVLFLSYLLCPVGTIGVDR